MVFPRSSSQTLFDIIDFQIVDPQDDEASPEVRMTISSQGRAGDEGHEDGGLLSLRDGLTQASFIKKPTERTDLFGLGAVLFDIISSGESAERFYELLRKYDARGTRIQQSILNLYPTWISGQAVAPDISAIFLRVSGDGRAHLNQGMLAFLLHCMMSEPDDSFYMRYFERKDGQQSVTGWPAVTSSIDALVTQLGAQDYWRVGKNALTAAKPSVPPHPLLQPSREAISVLLPSFQQSEPLDRWLRAASFLHAMMELTRRITHKIQSSKHKTAFISLKPEHLVLSRDDQIIKESDVVGHYSYSQYLGQLIVLDPLFSSLTSQPSAFLPVWWQSRLRRVYVRLWPEDDGAASTTAEAETDNLIRIAVSSTDFSVPGQSVQADDFLVVSNEESAHSLYDVREPGDGWLKILKNEAVEAERENTAVEFRCDEDRSGYLVKSFDAGGYYGGMLSVYLFYALFAGGGRHGVEHFGRAVISKALYYPMTNLPKPSALSDKKQTGWTFGRRKSKEEEIHELVHHTIRLYVWLMLGGFHRNEDRMDAIRSEISQWKDRVADILGRRPEEVDHLIFHSEDDEPAGKNEAGETLRRSLQVDEATWGTRRAVVSRWVKKERTCHDWCIDARNDAHCSPTHRSVLDVHVEVSFEHAVSSSCAYSGEADYRFRREADYPVRSSRSPVGAKRRGGSITRRVIHEHLPDRRGEPFHHAGPARRDRRRDHLRPRSMLHTTNRFFMEWPHAALRTAVSRSQRFRCVHSTGVTPHLSGARETALPQGGVY